MTTTPHGQVPEALIDLIDAYAETRHRCGGIYNARTEAARNAVIEALSEVQALSAAPVAQGDALPREDFAWMVVKEACETEPADEDDPECIRILCIDLKNAVLAAFLQLDAARTQAREGEIHE